MKYIIALVIVSLSGIFAYQLFWINRLYHSHQQQNREYIIEAIRNADHIELFSRADTISRLANKRRETFSQADDRGGIALTTRFRSKDSVPATVRIVEKEAGLPLVPEVDTEMKKVLESGKVRVGDDFSSLGQLR